MSGLGLGGHSLFARDVTNPVDDIANETDALEKLFLWEFTDNDLGLTTSEPLIGQLDDGTRVAIFGSGQGVSAAILYVVNLADGTLIQELAVSGTDSGGVTVAFSGSPLVTVTDPPEIGGNPLHISTHPVLTRNPETPGVIVYFGTGGAGGRHQSGGDRTVRDPVHRAEGLGSRTGRHLHL